MISSVDPELALNWDQQIASLAGVTFFHGSVWARVLRETYGFSPAYLIERGSEGVAAALPILEVDSWITGRRGVSLPFTDICAPLVHEASGATRLFSAAIAHGRARRWRTLELRGDGGLFRNETPSVEFHGHHLRLANDAARVFAGFDSSVRRAIRKAESSQLTIDVSSSKSAVTDFYRLVCRTRQRHGLPPQPFRFFASIYRNILATKRGRIVLVRRSNTPIAGGMFFEEGGTAIYKFGASDDRFREYRANNLMMWEAIQRYVSEGFHQLEFGRTSLRNDGLRRFKLGWGSTESQITYYKYDLQANQFVISRDEASGWYNGVFNRLPRCCSRLIGALLYKHVA